jgi:hypothetical protein
MRIHCVRPLSAYAGAVRFFAESQVFKLKSSCLCYAIMLTTGLSCGAVAAALVTPISSDHVERPNKDITGRGRLDVGRALRIVDAKAS